MRPSAYIRKRFDTGICMTSSYSIEKVGNDYVVKVDDQSVMTVASRRTAVRLVAVASQMLERNNSPEEKKPATHDAEPTGPLRRS